MSNADPLPNPARTVLRRHIEWADTDAAGIYHWTTAGRLAEAAEAHLHTQLGIDGVTFGATPRLGVTLEFKRSLVFNDAVDVEIAVETIGRSSVSYAVTIGTRDGDGPAVTGSVKACFIDRETRRATPWPDAVREALSAGGPQPAADR
jgi:acyl-CoA thioesterase FadM